MPSRNTLVQLLPCTPTLRVTNAQRHRQTDEQTDRQTTGLCQ